MKTNTATETLAQGQMPAEQQAELEERMGGDVAGFGIGIPQQPLIIVVCGQLQLSPPAGQSLTMRKAGKDQQEYFTA
jgi:hypothetical protein